MRPILFASATAITLNGRRNIMAAIHGDGWRPRRASLRIDVAPATSSVRSCWFPRFEIEPIRSFPPLECARGVNPIQAAKSRPVRKPAGSGTTARTVAAMIGPTPGIAVRRRALSSFLTASRIIRSSLSMRAVTVSICSSSSSKAIRAAPGNLRSLSSRTMAARLTIPTRPVALTMPSSAR